MLNEKRIRLMTKLARYESGEGKEGAGKEAGFPERTFSKFCSEYGTDGTGTLVLL